jgi:hypothetical protein
MRIPSTDRLKGQTLNASKAEFVWKFGNQQFIFGIEKNKKVYMEAGEVDGEGKYLDRIHWCEFPYDHSTLTSDDIWQQPKLFKYQNFFMTGSRLVPLAEDAMEFLK